MNSYHVERVRGVGVDFNSTVQLVTPGMAAAWLLKRDSNQRALSQATVDSYVRDMQDGAWSLTHQGIAFNREGLLIDGQHRLAAIVASGVPVSMLVTFGVDGDFSAPIDQGRGRSVNDITKLGTTRVATIGYLFRCESARMSGIRIGSTLAISTYARTKDLIDRVVDIGRTNAGNGRLVAPALGAIAYAWPINPVECERFLIQARDGELLKTGDPAYAFRGWLDRNRRNRYAVDIMLATMSAIRAHLSGEQLASVFTGQTGYRVITTKRRAMGIPNTPSTDLVESMSGPTMRHAGKK